MQAEKTGAGIRRYRLRFSVLSLFLYLPDLPDCSSERRQNCIAAAFFTGIQRDSRLLQRDSPFFRHIVQCKEILAVSFTAHYQLNILRRFCKLPERLPDAGVFKQFLYGFP